MSKVITMKFPETMTEQEVFDASVSFMLKQNKKSMEHEACRYRGPNGTACAVGCLIQDDEYDEKMDGFDGEMDNTSVNSLDKHNLLPARLRQHINLLKILQSVHDTCAVDTWPVHFYEIALERGLNIDVMKS